MRSTDIGTVVKSARKALGLTQVQLAQRARVTTRLLGELERGERPNVSLDTALRICAEVGIIVRLIAPDDAARDLTHLAAASAASAARQARAAARRATWSGKQVGLRDEGREEVAAPGDAKRLLSVAHLSRQAHAVAAAKRVAGARTGVAKHTVTRRASSRS